MQGSLTQHGRGSHLALQTGLQSEHTVQIRDLEIGFWAKCSHRFLKYLVKFRNWGAKVALDFYRAISKTRISTVDLYTQEDAGRGA